MTPYKRNVLLAAVLGLCIAALLAGLGGVGAAVPGLPTRQETERSSPGSQDAPSAARSITVAHLSDTHLGLEDRAPHAADNLRVAVEEIKKRAPDVVIVTGDIGQNRDDRQQARRILSELKARVHFVPGNHDAHGWEMQRYRGQFGRDYYRFEVGPVIFLALNSQLMGRWDDYNMRAPRPMPAEGELEFENMMNWLERQVRELKDSDRPVMVMQHVPHFRIARVLPDPRPYWTTQEPYRERVLQMMQRLGVRHIFAGHWHREVVDEVNGITYHLAPSTAWLPWEGELGFALHTISAEGAVQTEFVYPAGMRKGE